MPWLKVLMLLEPLLTGPISHPNTTAAQDLASKVPSLMHPSTPKPVQDAHLGQIFQLLLSSGLISPSQVPNSVAVSAPAS